MYIPFENIDAHSRLWVFQSNQPFREETKVYIESQLRKFTEEWTSHNHELEASYLIEHDRFIILAVNEAVNEASGCSIDKSVAVIKTLEEQLGITLMDKTLVSYIRDQGITTVKLSQIKDEISAGNLHETTLIFNTLVSTKAEYVKSFKSPAASTWLKRYFVKADI